MPIRKAEGGQALSSCSMLGRLRFPKLAPLLGSKSDAWGRSVTL